MKKLQSLFVITTLFIIYTTAFQRPNTKNTEEKLYQYIQTGKIINLLQLFEYFRWVWTPKHDQTSRSYHWKGNWGWSLHPINLRREHASKCRNWRLSDSKNICLKPQNKKSHQKGTQEKLWAATNQRNQAGTYCNEDTITRKSNE